MSELARGRVHPLHHGMAHPPHHLMGGTVALTITSATSPASDASHYRAKVSRRTPCSYSL